jgi:hypothetical protein
MRFACSVFLSVCLLSALGFAQTTPKNCPKFTIDQKGSTPIHPAASPLPKVCHPKEHNGFQLPDPDCTPGAINPTLPEAVLKDGAFRTSCVRNDATTEKEKESTYKSYKIKKPAHNIHDTQVCELDHLVPLYLGGADTLDNIWPQCGPSGAQLDERFFKQKDNVEMMLGLKVRHGEMSLAEAQRKIAEDWTQFLTDAASFCDTGPCDFQGR